MPLTIATDILFQDAPGSDWLRALAARAFGVQPERVIVADPAGAEPVPGDVQVLILHRSQDMPGDFPAWYGLIVDDALVDRIDSALNTVAHGLGTAALSDADAEDSMTLHLPDGSGHLVRITQDADDAFRVTPEMRQLIDGATRRPTSSARDRRRRIAG